MPATLHLQADNPADVELAASILQSGGLVAFPTETVYGLGANALSAAAVKGIFQAKQRPSWDPLIVHVASRSAVSSIAAVSPELGTRLGGLTEAFWPGPLTLLLPKTVAVPEIVTAGRPLVGIRVPAHPAANALLQTTGLPLAAPSANRFGHTSPTTAEHVLNDLDGRIDAVLDGGPCTVGLESTVLDPASTPMVVYRAGAVTLEALGRATGVAARLYEPEPVASAAHEPSALPSPGVGLRHYAPEVTVRLCGGTPHALWAEVEALHIAGERVGVLVPEGWFVPPGVRPFAERRWGRWDDPGSLARELFAALRAMERSGASVLVCPLPAPGGVRDALRDRLLKAAKPR